ncbi:MAG: hypothetical protein JWL81_361 [Verrucomicrobiales bacterium]|nr:hypothetical protein [Verrucomicrobiales bacterium]
MKRLPKNNRHTDSRPGTADGSGVAGGFGPVFFITDFPAIGRNTPLPVKMDAGAPSRTFEPEDFVVRTAWGCILAARCRQTVRRLAYRFQLGIGKFHTRFFQRHCLAAILSTNTCGINPAVFTGPG